MPSKNVLYLSLPNPSTENAYLFLSNEEDKRRKGIVWSLILTKMQTNASKPRCLDQGWLINPDSKWMQVKKINGLFSGMRQRKRISIGKKSESSQIRINETLKMMPGLQLLKCPISPNTMKNKPQTM